MAEFHTKSQRMEQHPALARPNMKVRLVNRLKLCLYHTIPSGNAIMSAMGKQTRWLLDWMSCRELCRSLSGGSAVLFVFLAFSARSAGLATNSLWQSEKYVPQGSHAWVQLRVFSKVSISTIPLLQNTLAKTPREFNGTAPLELQLPMPDGSLARFRIFESPVMDPALAAKFPTLKTYVGQGIDDPSATLRCDYTLAGFHAQILSPNGAVYVDPYWKDNTNFYVSYFKHDYQKSPDGFQCLSRLTSSPAVTNSPTPFGKQLGDNQLRTYRLACAATAEYVAFQSAPDPPNVAAGMAAIVTALNRVNGIYETELAVRLDPRRRQRSNRLHQYQLRALQQF